MPFKSKSNTTPPRRIAPIAFVSMTVGLILSGCSKTTLSSDGECNLFAPIYDSVKDTDETRVQIRIHNDIGMSVCGWKPKK